MKKGIINMYQEQMNLFLLKNYFLYELIQLNENKYDDSLLLGNQIC